LNITIILKGEGSIYGPKYSVFLCHIYAVNVTVLCKKGKLDLYNAKGRPSLPQ